MKNGILFPDMCSVMLNANPEEEEKLQDRRAALWSLAHIAALPNGCVVLSV